MESTHFDASEIATLEAELQDYDPAQMAIAQLKASDGDLTQALESMLIEEFGPQPAFAGKSLWAVTWETLREELCGDEGFLGRVKEYTAKPQKATALTALVIYIVEQTTLPISPSLAALVSLYIAKVGLTIFCKYTEPAESEKAELKESTLEKTALEKATLEKAEPEKRLPGSNV